MFKVATRFALSKTIIIVICISALQSVSLRPGGIYYSVEGRGHFHPNCVSAANLQASFFFFFLLLLLIPCFKAKTNMQLEAVVAGDTDDLCRIHVKS